MADRVGFIGLGIMGKPMAGHLLAAGYRAHRALAQRAAGGRARRRRARCGPRHRPRSRAASEVVVTMLPDTPDVELVLFGEDGRRRRHPRRRARHRHELDRPDPDAAVRRAARRAGASSARRAGLGRGEGRDRRRALDHGRRDARPPSHAPCRCFEAMGKNIVHVGPSGAGQIAKACNQLVVAATIEAVAEALVLAARAGVDPAKVREALLGGFAGSKILEVHGQRMLDRNFTPGFRARLHRKDARIVLDAAKGVDAPMPVVRGGREAARRTRGRRAAATSTTARCSPCSTTSSVLRCRRRRGRGSPPLGPRAELVDDAREVASALGEPVTDPHGRRRASPRGPRSRRPRAPSAVPTGGGRRSRGSPPGCR